MVKNARDYPAAAITAMLRLARFFLKYTLVFRWAQMVICVEDHTDDDRTIYHYQKTCKFF